MTPDILAYHGFYQSPLGSAVSDLAFAQMQRLWPNVKGMTVAGLGYGLPYLDAFEGEGAQGLALMPARQGVCHWPGTVGNRSALVNPYHLPLGDSALERMLVVHALEHVGRPEHLIRELWRVLAPGGEVVLMVPNRRRTWSAVDATPFGHGRPFSKRQLCTMLSDHMLSPVASSSVLMLPPFGGRMAAKALRVMERPIYTVGSVLGGGLGGVLLVRAVKQMYGVLPKGGRATVKVAVAAGGAA